MKKRPRIVPTPASGPPASRDERTCRTRVYVEDPRTRATVPMECGRKFYAGGLWDKRNDCGRHEREGRRVEKLVPKSERKNKDLAA